MATTQAGHDPRPRERDAHALAGAGLARTPQVVADDDPNWWAESTDGRCSPTAALFAQSQPAPLAIV